MKKEFFCRNCLNHLSDTPLIQYHNMPKSAQFFPGADELCGETGIDLKLYECRYCGLVQLSGDPVSYYREVIRATDVSQEMSSFREKQFSEWVSEYQLVGNRIIEIGACDGGFMDIMQRTGVEVVGLEKSKKSVSVARSKGLSMIEGYIESDSYRICDDNFDGFYSLNFLEHSPNPGEFIRGIAANLSDGAVGLIEVPNFDMILENNMFSELIQDHLSYFTSGTLRNCLQINGFEVLSIDVIWHDYILSARVRKRPSMDVSGFRKNQKDLKNEIDEFLFSEKKLGRAIAGWGAGHQALALLSLLGMEGQLECVIDSAEFKQGKYTPATHIPVVRPDVLDAGGIDTVIVMAGSYNEEIVNLIKEKHREIRVVTLGVDGLSV